MFPVPKVQKGTSSPKLQARRQEQIFDGRQELAFSCNRGTTMGDKDYKISRHLRHDYLIGARIFANHIPLNDLSFLVTLDKCSGAAAAV